MHKLWLNAAVLQVGFLCHNRQALYCTYGREKMYASDAFPDSEMLYTEIITNGEHTH